jgi:hypothetical protein
LHLESPPELRDGWFSNFVTGIRTVELADGSMHEELFEPEPLVQMVLSTTPSAVPHDAVVTGSVSPAPR